MPLEETNPAMEEMIKEIYRSMKNRMALQVNGNISKTNATYREGQTVVLMDIDFGKIVDNEATFQKLLTANPKTMEDTKKLVGDVEGMKVELKERLEISFQ